MEMVCAGHYETETFGVKALARAVAEKLELDTEFLPRTPVEAGN
jgi:putative NIF3 family GTP cyclohydrolase 1 type 2